MYVFKTNCTWFFLSLRRQKVCAAIWQCGTTLLDTQFSNERLNFKFEPEPEPRALLCFDASNWMPPLSTPAEWICGTASCVHQTSSSWMKCFNLYYVLFLFESLIHLYLYTTNFAVTLFVFSVWCLVLFVWVARQLIPKKKHFISLRDNLFSIYIKM